MTETKRIRWEAGAGGSTLGYAGTNDGWLFQIFETSSPEHGALALMSQLPGALGDYRRSDDPDELKAEAERWLEEFTSSLGAVFPDEPATSRKSRAWHADWAEVDRDQDGNAILRHKPSGGLYRVLPIEET